MKKLTFTLIFISFFGVFVSPSFAVIKTLECPSDKVHAPEVRLLYQQRRNPDGSYVFYFKPLEPIDKSQTWEEMKCDDNIKTSEGTRIISHNHSEQDLHICETKMYEESFFGLDRKLFAHFIVKYDFNKATQEMGKEGRGSTSH